MLNFWLEFQQTGAKIGSILCNVTWTEVLEKQLVAIVTHGIKILDCSSLLPSQYVTPVYWRADKISQQPAIGLVFSSQYEKVVSERGALANLTQHFHLALEFVCCVPFLIMPIA